MISIDIMKPQHSMYNTFILYSTLRNLLTQFYSVLILRNAALDTLRNMLNDIG